MIVPRFASIPEYARCFNEAGYWRQYIDAICRRHGFAAPERVDAGLPGTFPVFIVDGRYVVKLFGELFDGSRRFELERSVYGMLQTAPQIAAPALIGAGRLFPNQTSWSWPYLVSSVLPGSSFGEQRARVAYAGQVAIARWLGEQMHRFYALELPPTGELRPTWQRFTTFVQQRRTACLEQHRRWGALPEHLLAQIDGYVLPDAALLDTSTAPRLLHCDLNEDHVLGEWSGKHWLPRGIIDFGDAMVGDPVYDLVALHIGLCHGDKQLLRAFLEAAGTGIEQHPRFVQRAMSYTLLFEHNALGQVLSEHPAARELGSLAELAALLWDLERPAS